jgi:hypothetical protein
MAVALDQRVTAYLREHHVMTLATHGSEGVWAAAVFYVNDGYNLLFLSSPTSRHCRNLAESPRVSATIQQDYADWPEIKGVQLEGIATEVRGKEEQRARRLYGEKFPVIRGLAQAPVALAKAMDNVRWYKVVPERLYFIDNSAEFGHRDAIELPRRALTSAT